MRVIMEKNDIKLLNIMNMEAKDIIAVEDGVNDYAIFKLAEYAIRANIKEEFRVDKNCKSTLEMLQFIEEYIKIYNTGKEI